MKFRIQVAHYDKDEVEDPAQWGKEKIEWFNSTLRPNEKRRVFVGGDIMIQIQGVPIRQEEAKNIVSYDTISNQKRYHLIRVNFHSPLADIIFLFKDEKSRDQAFSDAKQEAI